MDWGKAKKDLTEIFDSSVKRVTPYTILQKQLSLSGNILKIKTPFVEKEFDLAKFNKILVTGAGKATASMAKGLESVLGNKIDSGIISVKYGYTEKLSKVQMIESGHPVPDQNSVKASLEIANLLKSAADEKTLIINLVSGGGSALLCLPYSDNNISLTLEEKQKLTKHMLECGAEIEEINCIRKHVSGIKGGRFARLLYPATCISLILSDIVGDPLESIASGISVPDPTTYSNVYSIMMKYDLLEKIPENIKKLVLLGKDGGIEETPKKGDKVFEKVHNILIGTNRMALLAAEEKAASLGYNTMILTSDITGEAKDIAKFFSALGRNVTSFNSPVKKPACIIAGGETTVTIKGKGKGGRNQEMALAFLEKIKQNPQNFSDIYFLSAGTDGSDGPTDAAGAFASVDILKAGEKKGISPSSFLANNDSYNYFNQTDGLLITGPTNTNVCDVQLVIIA